MRTIRHQFRDTTEANAFVAGVEWVNDSAVRVVDIEVGEHAVVVIEDEDGDEDALVFWHDNGDTYTTEAEA